MPNIDMTEVIKVAEEDEFWAVRGKAIQSYANLEQSLLTIFASLSGIKMDAAAIILFRISSADARNKIIERLFKRKFKDQFNLFRNSLLAQLGPVDRERNEIVHWNAACKMGHDGQKETAKVILIPPGFLLSPTQKTTEDLKAFDQKCSFYSGLINMFALVECKITEVPISESDKAPWQPIFAQPIMYPPPPDHPLFPKQQMLGNHIQAFLA